MLIGIHTFAGALAPVYPFWGYRDCLQRCASGILQRLEEIVRSRLRDSTASDEAVWR